MSPQAQQFSCLFLLRMNYIFCQKAKKSSMEQRLSNALLSRCNNETFKLTALQVIGMPRGNSYRFRDVSVEPAARFVWEPISSCEIPR